MRKFKLFFAFLLMAVLSIGQVWGEAGDKLYECTFPVNTNQSYTMNYSFTRESKSWKASVAQINGSVFYLGCSSTHASKGILAGAESGNPNNNGAWDDVISAWEDADNKYGTSVHAYALRFDNAYDNVGEVTFAWEGGNNAFCVFLFGDKGDGLELLDSTYYATSGATTPGSVTWTGTTSNFSSFAIVARPGTKTTNASNKTIRAKTFTIKEGSTSSCTKKVTISKGTPSNGDFTLSKTGDQATCDAAVTVIVTPDPDEHYKATGVTAPNSFNISAPDEDGKYTVTYAQSTNAASEINVNFTLKDSYTVTWDNNGNTSVTTQVYEGEKPVFPAKPASCATDCDKFYGWATEAWTGKLTDISGKTIHTSNATMDAVTAEGTVYYAVFTDVVATDYSTTYTSNVTLPSSGTNVSSATLVIGENDDIDAFKLGKSNAGATSSFTVPSGTTKIYLHAAAWNGKTVSLTLSTDVGSISPDDAQDLTANSGIANNSPFTLNTTGDGFDFDDLFFEYTLENVDEEAKITVTASGERAVIWGVNAVASASSGDAHYMTTCAACTHLVDAPELDGTIAVTHNTATINWKTLTNASSYDVTVIRNSDSESIFSGNVNALTKALTGLDPETQYDYSIMGVGDGSTYCTTGNEVLNGSFTTDAAPTAHLTLIDIEGTHASSGDYTVGTPFSLPTTAATCAKTFVGWDPDDECATAPTYAKGASFTFANTTGVTLHAVYANVEEDDETITPSAVADGDDPHAITINKSGYTLSANKNAGATAPTWNSTGSDVRIYAAGDITLASTSTMTRIVFNLSAQGKKRLAPITASVGTIATQAANDETVTWTGSATSVTFTVGATADYGSEGSTKAGQLCFSNIDVTVQGEFSNYSTTCVDAPVATPSPAALNDVAVAGASGTIIMTYENVNKANVAVSVWSNEACTEAIEGNWLTATLNGDKNIEYSIAEYNSYASNRSAYIKLTAPETNGATAPAVVKIPVSQVKKAAVFASLEELAAADVNANTEVTVSFSDVVIKEIYMYNSNRRGLTFNIQKDAADIKIYFNADVPAEWVAGGTVSGTLTNCPWKIYSGAWQLAPSSGWAWNNGDLSYTAPKAVSSVVVSGAPSKTTYVDGELFKPAGLTVTVNYTVGEPEVNPVGVTFTCDPERVAKGNTSVEVIATFNEVDSDPFEVTGLTVGDIQLKTVQEFITAGNADMRCYLEGTVSNYTNTTKGYFDLTDASGTIYIYGCDDPSSFAAGDKIKVIAEDYEFYNSKDEAKNVQFVSKISPVEITIADKTLEEGANWTIVATTNPAAAVTNISYSIKEGSDDCITLDNVNKKITANSVGTATIIASIPDGEGYFANSIEFNVHVTLAIVRTGIYAKVTSNEELTDGEYLIVYENENGNLAFDGSLSSLNESSNNFAVTIDNDTIIATAEIDANSFTINVTEGTNRTIKSASGKFIGRTGDSNGMNESTTEAYTNTISIDGSGNADIVGAGGAHLRYNSSSDVFRYYKSSTYTGQKAIQLYRKMDYTRAVSGNYGTICLPKAGVLTNGALYEIAEMDYQDNKPYKIYFDEVEGGVMEAGKPYIFKPNDGVTVLRVVYTDTIDAPKGNYKGLYGEYSKTHLAKDAGNYILKNNQYYYVNSDNVYCEANRAYIKLSEVPEYDNSKPSYGRRRIALNVNNEQVATGMDELNASEAPVKVMIDGKFYILRGEKMYDATGRLVK